MCNHLQYYLAHYAALAAGICAIIAKLDPNVLGPNGAALVGAAVAGIAVAHALGIRPISPLVGVSLVPTTPAPADATKQGGRASLVLLVVLTVATVAAMVSCASFTKTMGNPASATAIQAAVDLAVGTTIQATAKTPVAQVQEATQITSIAGDLEKVLSGESVTLAALDQLLQQKIDAANLPAPDKAAAMLLASTVQSIILQQIQGAPGSTPPLSANQTVAVKAVLDDVIQAAGFYGVHARAVVRADLAPQ